MIQTTYTVLTHQGDIQLVRRSDGQCTVMQTRGGYAWPAVVADEPDASEYRARFYLDSVAEWMGRSQATRLYRELTA